MKRKHRILTSLLIVFALVLSTGALAEGFTDAASVGSISEGMVSFRTENGLWGFADLQGNTVFRPEWDYVYSFSGGIARVFTGTTSGNGSPKDGLYGYLKQDGTLIRPRWVDAGNFSEGFAAVRENGKWGFIDETGTVVIPCQWDYVAPFSNGRALVFNGTLKSMNYPDEGNYGFIDTQGNLISDGWEYAGSYADGCARIQLNGKYGYIDLDGAYVSEPQWDFASDFLSGFGMVFMGTLDKYGTPVEGLYGYVGADGQVIEPQWDAAVSFHEGLAPVRRNYKWGYIDATGAEVIACDWDYAYFFNSGVGVTYNGDLNENHRPTNGMFYMIDTEGRVTGQIAGREAPTFLNGYASLAQDGRYGVIDRTGSVVLGYQWDARLYFDENGYAVASQNGRRFIVDVNGVNQYGVDTDSEAFLLSLRPFDVRQSHWGDTPEQVRAAEGTLLHEYVPDPPATWISAYQDTVAGVNSIVIYSFCNDGLYSVMIHQYGNHSDPYDYIEDYYALQQMLFEEHGEPTVERVVWDTEQHKRDYSNNPGYALQKGWLSMYTAYENDRSIFILNLEGGGDFNLFVQYYSTELTPD